MRGSKLITLAEASRIVGVRAEHPSRWLVRRLKRLKRETGTELLVPQGEGKKRPRYRVSLVRLRRHLPELFDVEGEREDHAAAAAAAFHRIERKLLSIDDRIDSSEQRLGAIHARLSSQSRPK